MTRLEHGSRGIIPPKSRLAVARYNELCGREAVGALIHTTC